MNKLAIVTMVLGLGLGACKGNRSAAEPPLSQTAAPETLALTWKAPAVGRTETRHDNLETRMKLTDPQGQVADVVMVQTEQTHAEVVAVTPDGAIATVKVRYEADDERQTFNGQTQDKPSPIEGKTYVVSAEAGAIKASRDDGSPVSPEEQAAVAEEEEELGKIPGMARLLISRSWTTGKQVDLTPEEITEALGGDDDMTPLSGSLTLDRVDGGVATFEMGLTAFREDADGRMNATMSITIELEVEHVRPIAMRMTGTLEGTIQGMKTTGAMSGTKTFEYR